MDPIATSPGPAAQAVPLGRARLGIQLILWGWVAQWVSALSWRFVSAYSSYGIATGNYDHALGKVFGTLSFAGQGAGWLLGITIAAGLFLAIRLGTAARAEGLAWGAFGCWTLTVVFDTGFMVMTILQEAGVHLDWESLAPIYRWMWIPGFAGEVISLGLLLFLVARYNRLAGHPPMGGRLAAAAAGMVVLYGFHLVQAFGLLREELSGQNAWIGFAAGTVTSLAMTGALAWLLFEFLRRLGQPGAAPLETKLTPEVALGFPPRVRQGLTSYRAALVTRLWVLVGGLVMIFCAALAQSLNGVRLLTVATSLLALVTEIWMITGLARYCSVPERTRAQGPAVLAVVIMGAGCFLDLISLVFVFMLFSDDPSTLMQAVRVSPYLEAIAQVLAVSSLIALLFSFSRIGRALGVEGVSERITLLGILLGVVIPLALFARLALVKEWVTGAGGLVLAGFALALAVIALVLFLGLLRRLIDRLGAPPVDHLPSDLSSASGL